MAKGIYVTGDKELDKQLRTLGDRAAKKLFRRATRSGAKKMQAPITETIPVSGQTKSRKWTTDKTGKPHGPGTVPGTLKKTIKVRAMKRSRSGRIGHSIVIGGDMADYVAKVELGTKRMRPKRTIRDAFDQNENSVGSQFVNDIWDEIKAEVSTT